MQHRSPQILLACTQGLGTPYKTCAKWQSEPLLPSVGACTSVAGHCHAVGQLVETLLLLLFKRAVLIEC